MYIMGTILRHGSPEQKAKYLPAIATGELRLQAFGVTEPTIGHRHHRAAHHRASAKATSTSSTARRSGPRRAEHSDLMLLLARTTPRDQVAKKTEGLSTFIVDMRTALGKGLTIRPIRTMMNHNSCEVFFDNMEVPAENLVGVEGKGFRYILDGMNAERLLIAAECIGDAKWFIDKARRLREGARAVRPPDRPEPGRAVPDRQAPMPRCAPPRLIVQKGLHEVRAGQPCGEEANMGKMLAAEAAWAAAEACVQTHGGFGFAEEYDIERKFREARLYQVAPISTNLILAYIGEHVLGMPRSY